MSKIPYTERDRRILAAWRHEMRWSPDPQLARTISAKDWREMNRGVKAAANPADTEGKI